MLRYRRLFMDSPFLEERPGDAAGFDLPCYLPVVLKPGVPTNVDTGIAVELPKGTVGLVLGRSGLAFKDLIHVVPGRLFGEDLFHIGTIDSDYRGSIRVMMINYGREDKHLYYGDRIAQLLVLTLDQETYKGQPQEVEFLQDTDRGSKGFGSTGV